jgi:hypothetical protein
MGIELRANIRNVVARILQPHFRGNLAGISIAFGRLHCIRVSQQRDPFEIWAEGCRYCE